MKHTQQLFKINMPNDTLFNLLDNICIKENNVYTFNLTSFKKGIFTNDIQQFIEECKNYYHLSKHKYLNAKLVYNSFTTILRQICNNNKINYTSKIKYDKSAYEIIYYIYE